MASTQYLKISLFLKKLPEIIDQQFHEHWKNQHVNLAKENKKFMAKTRKYNQVHITPELREQAKMFGIPVMDYDGIAEVWVDSLEDWKEVVGDAEFVKVIAADESLFIQAPIHVQLSYDNLVIPERK